MRRTQNIYFFNFKFIHGFLYFYIRKRLYHVRYMTVVTRLSFWFCYLTMDFSIWIFPRVRYFCYFTFEFIAGPHFPINCNVITNDDGTHTATYVPEEAGPHRIHIKLDGKNIDGNTLIITLVHMFVKLAIAFDFVRVLFIIFELPWSSIFLLYFLKIFRSV